MAFTHTWNRLAGAHFPALQNLCLKPSEAYATRWDCPRECGCFHSIIVRHDRTGAVAACRCQPPACPDIPLTLQQITPLYVDVPKLGRAIARAFQCAPQFARLGLPFTAQIGSWSPAAVPVIFTTQVEAMPFRLVVAQLAATTRKPFILFAPTAHFINTHVNESLSAARAAFFDLASHTILKPDGTLAPTTPPSDLFASFSPVAPSSRRHAPSAPLPAPRAMPRYALRKGLGVWHLIFDGKEADIRHEKGIFYVAWLLYNPPEHPIHALDLMAKVPEIYRQQLGLPALVDQTTGQAVALESHARLQERSLALDDREAMRRLYRKENQLEAILDSDASEPEKAEALRDLEAIYQFQRHNTNRSKDAARKTALLVRQAINRFHSRLLAALDTQGNPHPVLRPFAAHLQNYVLLPSSRCLARTGSHARTGIAGAFTYEPPPGIYWRPF